MNDEKMMADPMQLGLRPIGFEDIEGVKSESELPEAANILNVDTCNSDMGIDAPPAAQLKSVEGLLSGRYVGGNHQIFMEIRVDTKVCGVVSSDLFRRDPGGGMTYVASLRTMQDKRVPLAKGALPLIAEDRNGNVTSGQLSIFSGDEEGKTLHGSFFLSEAVEGLPFRRQTPFSAEWQGEALRQLGLEIESEEAVALIPEISFRGAPMSVGMALAGAGIETYTVGSASRLPKAPRGGWSEKTIEALMHDFAQSSLDRPAFELHLLWLSESNRAGLLGVMFDVDDMMPRQGLAIFAEEIRKRYPPGHRDLKLIQTTVHEIGHALNLAHRFERVVGRADSLSFMNYDWRYRGGRRETEFWDRFRCTFDDDELAFLRHGPLRAVVPGGAAFHSARYWAEGTGGYSPYVPETQLPGFRLSLDAPQNGPIFAFGQPVILGIRLKNETGHPLRVPPFLLDPKAGFVEILIRRLDLTNRDRIDTKDFVPIAARCFDVVDTQVEVLQPNAEKVDNINLTFGAAGFSFAEPGMYQVTALLVIYDPLTKNDQIAASAPLTIRIAYPHDVQEERDAMVLFRTDVGRYFALGGSDRLSRAADDLQEIASRRSHGQRKTKAADYLSPLRDPIAVNVVRCQGFQAARECLRYEDGKMVKRDGDLVAALRHLELLDAEALRVFDPQTAASTKGYRDNLEQATRAS